MSLRRIGGGLRRGATRMFGHVKDSWMEMGVAGGVGFVVPDQLSKLGFGKLLYDKVPMYATAVDTLYDAAGKVSNGFANNPWRDGGLRGWAKTYGLLDGSKTALSAAKSGGFSRGSLVKEAFDLGLVFDGPDDFGGVGGGGGGYW